MFQEGAQPLYITEQTYLKYEPPVIITGQWPRTNVDGWNSDLAKDGLVNQNTVYAPPIGF